MDLSKVYKVKDSIDLFLCDNKIITVYYMNTRRRKSFRISKDIIPLLENIDGVKNVEEISKVMQKNFHVEKESVVAIMELLQKNKIITVANNNPSYLSNEDFERYNRQMNYFSEFFEDEKDGEFAQNKLLCSHITIFGCGAIGGDITLQLAMAGVRHFKLFDYDKVEMSDAARHMYYTKESIGKNKTEQLADRLKLIDSKVQVEIINESMQPTSDIENIIEKSDFVVNTLDEPYIGYTSSKISRICIKHRIPHYIAGGFDAHLASTGEMVLPYITPCVECYADHFKTTLKNWKPKKHPVVERHAEIGGLASMSLFSSSFACIEIVKYLAGLVDLKNDFKVRGELPFDNLNLTYLNVKKNPKCPVCGGKNE